MTFPGSAPGHISTEDADGNLVTSTIVFDFGTESRGPCIDVEDGPLAPNESFEDCTLFLFEPDAQPATVTFLSQPEGTEPEFVRWAVP